MPVLIFFTTGLSTGTEYMVSLSSIRFVGVNSFCTENYPYTEILRIDHCNNSKFPFQIDQTIINGRRFFEWLIHYKKILDEYLTSSDKEIQLNETAQKILKTINTYEGKNRTGDGYVRTMFDCAIIYYIDKFGLADISKAIEKIFIWAYSFSLNYKTLQLASMDNYAVYEMNLFRIIKNANKPDEILTLYIKPIAQNRSTKTKEIEP